MDVISLIGIAIGLSMDAFAVSITNGAVTRNVTFGFATKLAASFGLFQAAMPMIGWAVGKAGEGFISKIVFLGGRRHRQKIWFPLLRQSRNCWRDCSHRDWA